MLKSFQAHRERTENWRPTWGSGASRSDQGTWWAACCHLERSRWRTTHLANRIARGAFRLKDLHRRMSWKATSRDKELSCLIRIPLASIAKKWVFPGLLVIQQSQGLLTGKTVKGKKNLIIELVVSYRDLVVHAREIRRRRDPPIKVT